MTSETLTYIHFAFVDDVEVLSFLALLNDHITGEMNFRKHCIKDLCSFILIQMAIEKKSRCRHHLSTLAFRYLKRIFFLIASESAHMVA